MIKKAAAVLIFLTAITGNLLVFSQESTFNPIQTVVPFLTIAPDSRAASMGNAGVATSPDAFSMHWNPAKFAFIDGAGGFGISYIPWLRNLAPDINFAYLSGYKRLDSKQVLSAGLIYAALGRIEVTREDGSKQLDIYPNEFAFDAAYSRIFADHLSGGIAFRFIYSNLTNGVDVSEYSSKPGISFAADISGYYHNNINIFGNDGILAVGLAFTNIGSKMNYTDSQTSDFIPMNMRLGTALTINFDKYNKLTAAIDFNKLLVPTDPIYYMKGEVTPAGDTVSTNGTLIKKGKDRNVSVPVAIFQSFYDAPGGFSEELKEITISPAIEYWYNDQFALRAGYFHESAMKGNRKYFTAGAGFRLRTFSIDFSYLIPTTQNNPLANTLQFSLAFDFNSLRNANKSRR
jgi:hypothetical protein